MLPKIWFKTVTKSSQHIHQCSLYKCFIKQCPTYSLTAMCASCRSNTLIWCCMCSSDAVITTLLCTRKQSRKYWFSSCCNRPYQLRHSMFLPLTLEVFVIISSVRWDDSWNDDCFKDTTKTLIPSVHLHWAWTIQNRLQWMTSHVSDEAKTISTLSLLDTCIRLNVGDWHSCHWI